MAWLSETNTATLDSLGAKIAISEETSSSVVSVLATNPLRQVVTVSVCEYRGLTRTAAVALRANATDSTTQTTYYATAAAGTLGKRAYVSALVTTGAVTTVSAARADESDQWIARFTTTTYSASGSGWSTTAPSGATTTGYVTGKSTTSERKECCRNGVVLGVIYLYHTITTTEYNYLTQSAASTLCASASSSLTTNTLSFSYIEDGTTGTESFSYQTGTVTSYDMRFVSNDEGFTVTKTEEVISYSATASS